MTKIDYSKFKQEKDGPVPETVFQKDGEWWHTDETYDKETAFGPFETKEEAKIALEKYGIELYQDMQDSIKDLI